MNRNPYPGQLGLPQDSCNDADGANYLRRLKATVAVDPAHPQTAPTVSDAAAMASVGVKERRESPRLRCSGSVEFQADGNHAHTWGTLTDISLHGCYVEMSNTFPIDTHVNLVLKSCGLQIQTAGTVRATYPALGMGIRFADTEPPEQGRLKQLLALLSGHSLIPNLGPQPKALDQQQSLVQHALDSADHEAFLGEIKAFFQKNSLLSRDKFHEIAQRIHRA